jgi:carbon monoxide dehydrogenase subunit G
MQVDLQKTFPVEAPASSSWQVLSDIETVASCMPGAEVTGKVDDSNYTGKVKSKIGPATMAFDGTIQILGIDEANRELRMTSKGQDSKGSSSAQMDLVARVVDAEGGTSELHGEAKVIVNGKVASLGGRMMTQVADQILNQFGDNFAARAQSLSAGAATGEVPPAPEPKAINGLAFIWAVLVGFFKSLFGGKSSKS